MSYPTERQKSPPPSLLKRIDVITLFPEMFSALNYGVTGRALRQHLLALQTWNPRDYAIDKHRSVDDRPYGGGPGMVMSAPPLHQAVKAAQADQPDLPAWVIYLSPAGHCLTQATLNTLVTERQRLILVAGRYEGVDQRFIDLAVDEVYSIGDYVLSGGEIAGLVMIDSLVRLLPGALGSDESAQQDSFMSGLLDWPHYTRPDHYQGLPVPEVLSSGNHEAISRWRLKQSLGRTALYRPDLLKKRKLSSQEQLLLHEFVSENKNNDK